MLSLPSGQSSSLAPWSGQDRSSLVPWSGQDRRQPSTGLLIAGVVVVGLGFLAWSYLGPDLRRYMKIHSM
jgi:hypothetical protein